MSDDDVKLVPSGPLFATTETCVFVTGCTHASGARCEKCDPAGTAAWYAEQSRVLGVRIADLEAELAKVTAERDEAQTKLAACAERLIASGIKRAEGVGAGLALEEENRALRERVERLERLLQVVASSLITMTKAVEDGDTAQVGEAIIWLRSGIAKALTGDLDETEET